MPRHTSAAARLVPIAASDVCCMQCNAVCSRAMLLDSGRGNSMCWVPAQPADCQQSAGWAVPQRLQHQAHPNALLAGLLLPNEVARACRSVTGRGHNISTIIIKDNAKRSCHVSVQRVTHPEGAVFEAAAVRLAPSQVGRPGAAVRKGTVHRACSTWRGRSTCSSRIASRLSPLKLLKGAPVHIPILTAS